MFSTERVEKAAKPGYEEYSREVGKLAKRVLRLEDAARFNEHYYEERLRSLAEILKVEWIRETKVPGHYEKKK